MITEETISRVKSSLQATKSFLALEVIELLEKENAGLKNNLERYSQKITEQEETIDAQDDKINFYVAKMNENILKRQELEKENAELKQKLESDQLALNEATEIIAELKYNLKCRDDELAESKAEIESLTNENNILIKGLGCETCSISGEYLKLNNTIRELESQIEKMKCCMNCKNEYNRYDDDEDVCCNCNNENCWKNWELVE